MSDLATVAPENHGYEIILGDRKFVDFRFKSDVSNFLCAVCQGVARETVTMCPTGHVFCTVCVEAWRKAKKTKSTCPTCRGCLPGNQLIKLPIIDQLVEGLEIQCCHQVNEGPTCRWTGRLKDLRAHIQSCHSHCPNRRNGCSFEGQQTDLDSHRNVCLFNPISCCVNAVRGCPFVGDKVSMAAHKAICPKKLDVCQKCMPPQKVALMQLQLRSCNSAESKCICNNDGSRKRAKSLLIESPMELSCNFSSKKRKSFHQENEVCKKSRRLVSSHINLSRDLASIRPTSCASHLSNFTQPMRKPPKSRSHSLRVQQAMRKTTKSRSRSLRMQQAAVAHPKKLIVRLTPMQLLAQAMRTDIQTEPR